MVDNYIDAKTFNDFKCNQEQLIVVLNHTMTKLTVDVQWLKAQGKWVIGLLGGIFVAVIATVVTKLV